MAVSFPLATTDLADLMMIETVTWSLTETQHLSMSGDGEFLAKDLAPRLWEATCSTIAADKGTIEALRARFNLLDGAIQSFYLYDPKQPNPATDPKGTVLASANVTIGAINANRKELQVLGLPIAITLPTGTRLSITAGTPSRTWMGQLAAPLAGAGALQTAAVEFRPHLRPWVAVGQSVRLLKPVAKVKLLPRSLTEIQVSNTTWRLRFVARQTLAAG